MIQVPQRGPGCQHFVTCAMCLMAPKFMGCGWCSGVCSWESECHKRWRNESCSPAITGVSYVLYPRAHIPPFATYKKTSFQEGTIMLYLVLYSALVFSTVCSPWRSNRAHGFWVGISVPLKTCHHFKNPPDQTGTDCLHRASGQKQQHTVSFFQGKYYNHCSFVLFWGLSTL